MSILTVTTPATDTTLLTPAELRAAVGVTDGSQDAALATLGASVAATIARACRIATGGATPPTLRLEVLSEVSRQPRHRSALVLARRPVTAVASVTEIETAVAADDYEIDAAAGILRRLSDDRESCWPCGKLVIAYTAGWATVPADLKLAASKLAAALWSEGQKVDQNLKSSEIPGVETRTYWVGPVDDPLIPAEVLDLLAPYTERPIA